MTTQATTSKIVRFNTRTISKAVEDKNAALDIKIAEHEAKQETEQHKDALKELHDAIHNSKQRKARLDKFMKLSKKTQSYILKNVKDQKAALLETSSIYALDTLLSFSQAATKEKLTERNCFYVFFECFAKKDTVSAREIQTAMMRKCSSSRSATGFYTAESARTWTRNCFHAMNCMQAMSEEKVSKEIFYTINLDSQFTKDLMNTALLNRTVSDSIELDESDIERA